jgi:hypothetical protein
LVKNAKKSEKARTTSRGEQMRADLKSSHEYEIDSFGAATDGSISESSVSVAVETSPSVMAEDGDKSEQEKIGAKKAKANRKKVFLFYCCMDSYVR